MNEHEDPEELQAFIAAQLAGPPPIPTMMLHDSSSESLGARPIDWRRLSDDAAAAEWAALREWVEWFTVRYNLPVSIVPVCWFKHGALVEELSALFVAHLASFDERDTGYGPIGWHERFSLAHPRLQRAGAGCASGHNETRPRSWVGATDEQEWDAWITQTHAHRGATRL